MTFSCFINQNDCSQVWSCDIIVDWADPQEEPDEGTMSKVKVLYVRNLTQEISEEKLKVSVKAADLTNSRLTPF